MLGESKLKLIIDCLYNLQNRGYDSAGISIIEKEKEQIIFYKKLFQNSIKELEEIIDSLEISSPTTTNKFYNILAHTRWATHGGIKIENCHPHSSNNEKIILVHNGIIENYVELKKFLIKKNFKFYSETDSEIIVNLIEYYNNLIVDEQSEEEKFEQSINKALNDCSGTWGLVIQNKMIKDKLFCVRNGSPLLIGKSEKYIIITSEINGFNNNILTYHELLNNKLYTVSSNNVKHINFEKIIDNPSEINRSSKNEFEHWMLKEIYDQKDIVKKITNNYARIKNDKIKFGGLFEYREQILYMENIILVGCGTSYNACLFSKKYFYNHTNYKNIICIDACNFNKYDIPKTKKNLFVFVSQSGETKDLFDVLNEVNGLKIGIINVVDSLIARHVDCGIYMNIGEEKSVASTKVFLAECLLLILLSLWISNDEIIIKRYLNDLKNFQNLIINEIDNFNTSYTDETIKYLIDNGINGGFVIGDKDLYSICLEIALKIKEVTYLHYETLTPKSLKHGPLVLVTKEKFCNIILGHSENDNVVNEILSRHGKIILNNFNEDNVLSNLLYIVRFQFIAYKISIIFNINPDFPRNLAKVVTV